MTWYEDRWKESEAQFRRDVQTHITAIRQRYFIPGETQDTAILFVPSEAIYADLCEHFSDLVQRAHRARIVICAPNMLMLAVHTMQAILKDVQRHPAKRHVLHMDMQRIVETEKLRMRVPLHFTGEGVCPVGETLEINRRHLVRVAAVIEDVPEEEVERPAERCDAPGPFDQVGRHVLEESACDAVGPGEDRMRPVASGAHSPDVQGQAARAPPQLSAALKSTITIELRDAPVKSVFEMIAKRSGLNFVYDKDIPADLRTSVFVRDTSIEEVMKTVLMTSQLEKRVHHPTTLLIYPNTPEKAQAYKELVVRSFYLDNADARQTANMVRSLVKTRDLYVDEKLNLLVIRDTPEAVRIVDPLDGLRPRAMAPSGTLAGVYARTDATRGAGNGKTLSEERKLMGARAIGPHLTAHERRLSRDESGVGRSEEPQRSGQAILRTSRHVNEVCGDALVPDLLCQTASEPIERSLRNSVFHR